MTSEAAAESKPEVGSSRKRILGPVTSCDATLTRRFCPSDTPFLVVVPIRLSASSESPKAASKKSMRSLQLYPLEGGEESRSAKLSVSRTVREPIKASSCST